MPQQYDLLLNTTMYPLQQYDYCLTMPQQYDLLLNTTTYPLQQYDLLLDHAITV